MSETSQSPESRQDAAILVSLRSDVLRRMLRFTLVAAWVGVMPFTLRTPRPPLVLSIATILLVVACVGVVKRAFWLGALLFACGLLSVLTVAMVW